MKELFVEIVKVIKGIAIIFFIEAKILVAVKNSKK